jgi:hypothetical protein
MKSLKLHIEAEDIFVSKEIKDSFKHPLVFYLLNYRSFYLCSFVIVDFQNEQIKYIESLSDDNISIISNAYNEDILKDPPHSLMVINKNKLMNLIYSVRSGINNTFRVLDLEKEVMEIYTPEDLGYNHLGRVSETGTKDPYDSSSFYICFVRKDKLNSEYYKVSTDLSKSKFLFNDGGKFKKAPHQIVRCGNFILSSGFGEEEGQILSYNIKSKEISVVPTIAKPSHLEVDGNIVYYASNNMNIEGTKVSFIGPARIGKLKVNEDSIEKCGEFWNESGFRFTTHKVLDKNTLVTFGFPNRLFFIDSNSMKLLFHYDVGKTILPDENQLSFINNQYEQTLNDPFRYTALEVSYDQKYVVFFDQKNVKFFNFKTRNIVFEIPYKIKEGYFQLSHHCDFLR